MSKCEQRTLTKIKIEEGTNDGRILYLEQDDDHKVVRFYDFDGEQINDLGNVSFRVCGVVGRFDEGDSDEFWRLISLRGQRDTDPLYKHDYREIDWGVEEEMEF